MVQDPVPPCPRLPPRGVALYYPPPLQCSAIPPPTPTLQDILHPWQDVRPRTSKTTGDLPHLPLQLSALTAFCTPPLRTQTHDSDDVPLSFFLSFARAPHFAARRAGRGGPVVVSNSSWPVVVSSTSWPVVVSSTSWPVVVNNASWPVVASSTSWPVVASSTSWPVVASSTSWPVVARSRRSSASGL
jgi:hypothetical protein